MKEVWETLYEEKALPFRYDAFIGYVNKLIRRPPPSQKGPLSGREHTGHAPGQSPESVESAKSPDTAVTPDQPPVLKKVEPDKFVFDSKPNAKELI